MHWDLYKSNEGTKPHEASKKIKEKPVAVKAVMGILGVYIHRETGDQPAFRPPGAWLGK